jgi:hypothetical protein
MERECNVRSLTTSGGVARRSCCVLVAASNHEKLLLFGGVGANLYFNDLHEFNLETNHWVECYPIGSKPSPRGGCASSLLQQRTLLIFGGRGEDGFVSDLFSLDLVHLGWSPVHVAGQRPGGREDAVMATAPSGLVFLLGGCGAAGAESDLWRFDPTQAHWDLLETNVAPFPHGVAAPSMASSDQYMFVFGGYDRYGTFMNNLWRLSLDDQVWHPIEVRGGVPRPRTHGQLALCDGNLILYGGYSTTEALSDMWQLVAVSHDATSIDCLVIIGEELRVHAGLGTVLARGAAASAIAHRTLFVFGGCDGKHFLQDVISVSLPASERSPPRRQTPNVNTRLWEPQSLSHTSHQHSERHPYNVLSPMGETTRLAPVVSSSPSVATPTRGPSVPTLIVSSKASVGGNLMHAITDLKAELFGPRVAQVDTIMEENRKLREENAKLQQTVLDLMRKLSAAGSPSTMNRDGASQWCQQQSVASFAL